MITMKRERRSRAARDSAARRKALTPDWIEIQYYDGMFRSVYGSRVAPCWHEAVRHRARRKVV